MQTTWQRLSSSPPRTLALQSSCECGLLAKGPQLAVTRQHNTLSQHILQRCHGHKRLVPALLLRQSQQILEGFGCVQGRLLYKQSQGGDLVLEGTVGHDCGQELVRRRACDVTAIVGGILGGKKLGGVLVDVVKGTLGQESGSVLVDGDGRQFCGVPFGSWSKDELCVLFVPLVFLAGLLGRVALLVDRSGGGLPFLTHVDGCCCVGNMSWFGWAQNAMVSSSGRQFQQKVRGSQSPRSESRGFGPWTCRSKA